VLDRRYHEGEKLIYRMKGANEQWRYEIQATGVVKKDSNGKYFEEYAWSNLISNGEPFALPPPSVAFRQTLSLDPAINPSVPNLALVNPMMIGPITDLLTFYADLWLASKAGGLTNPGDHLRQKGPVASWADGNYVILGQDSIDFDITLTGIDQANAVATLVVKHVVPEKPDIKLPVAWMREPVSPPQNAAPSLPNNWVNVTKGDGKYVAAAGQETFEVNLKVSLTDGKILSGSLVNPVKARERDCTDAALTDCGASRPHEILRRIEISLER
jgi:hypothetical protein